MNEIGNDVMRQAVVRMWIGELEAMTPEGKPDWPKRRIAGAEICDLFGISAALKAVSAGGELKPPPTWPAIDIAPIGGGTGFLRCDVRTVYHGKILSVSVTIKVLKKESHAAQIEEALARGRFELKKQIDNA